MHWGHLTGLFSCLVKMFLVKVKISCLFFMVDNFNRLLNMFLLYGTFGSPIEATKEIQEMCNIVKEQAEFNTHKEYEEFRAVQYRIQVVSGTNYLIKVHVGREKYLHVMVFQGFPCYGGALLLTRVQEGYKTRDEPLIPYPD